MSDQTAEPTTEPSASIPPPAPPAAPPSAPSGPPPSVEPWRDRGRWERAGDIGSLVWGVILVAVGGWFFVEQTLGYDLPAIDWGIAWPIVIIVIGGWVVLRATGRRPT